MGFKRTKAGKEEEKKTTEKNSALLENEMEKDRDAKQVVMKRTILFMLKTAWKEKPSLFLLYAVNLSADVLDKVREVLLPKFLLDELALVLKGAGAEEHLRNLWLYAVLLIGSQMVISIVRNTVNLAKQVQKEWFDEFFNVKLANHAMTMDFEHTENPKALDQMNRAKEGVSWYSEGVVGVLDECYRIVMNAVVLIGVVAVILLNCPLLLPLQILSLLAIAWFNARNNALDLKSFQKLAKSNRIFSYLMWQLVEFQYGKDIRLYDSAQMMSKKAQWFSEEQVGIWADKERKKRKNSWAMDNINALRDGISYFYIGYLALKKVITVGDFSMCVTAASSLYWSLAGIVTGAQQITQKCSYAYQFLKFLDYPAAMPKGSRAVQGGKHTIEFSHVSFRYPRSEKDVLRDINLKITSGEHLAVVGLNGAGKTTFIKLLCRLYDVTEGEILIDGINIKEYSEEEYRRLFAVVFQDFQLFAFSLWENIVLGEEMKDAEVEQVLRQSGLYEDAVKLDKGFDTMLYKSFDEHGTELSGGQKQKTAISRALYRNAPIVILDEPTAALDPVAEYEIYKQFHSLVGGRTAIYISHRLSSCKFCDKIAVFADDTIKEYGSHDELVDVQGGIYAKMFAAQAQYYVENGQEA